MNDDKTRPLQPFFLLSTSTTCSRRRDLTRTHRVQRGQAYSAWRALRIGLRSDHGRTGKPRGYRCCHQRSRYALLCDESKELRSDGDVRSRWGALHATRNLRPSKRGDRSFTANITFGPLAQGVSEGHFVGDEGTLSGDFDGRQITRADANTRPENLRFEDGNPSPILVASKETLEVVRVLTELALSAPIACGDLAAAKAISTQDLPYAGDPGHFPFRAPDCNVCHALCDMNLDNCLHISLAACLPLLLLPYGGFWYAACALFATSACVGRFSECFSSCEHDGECCPSPCGAGHPCCFGNEQCLDPTVGLCCSKGTSPCAPVGAPPQCCVSGDSCLQHPTGAKACCAKGNPICMGPTGDECCEPGDRCDNNQGDCCVRADMPCGTAGCCNRRTHKCENPALGDCCPKEQDCPGTPERCCDDTKICIHAAGGNKCCAPEKTCPTPPNCCTGTCVLTPYDGGPQYCCELPKFRCGASDCCTDVVNCVADALSGLPTCCGEHDASFLCVDLVHHMKECCRPGQLCAFDGQGEKHCLN